MKRQVREKARILAGSNGPAGGPLAVSAEGPAMSGLGHRDFAYCDVQASGKKQIVGITVQVVYELKFYLF